MANHGTAPTVSQFAEFVALVIRALPRAVKGIDVREFLRRFQNDGEGLSRVLKSALIDSFQPPKSVHAEPSEPEPKPPVHADICIERLIGGKKFRFRGFIRDDDEGGLVLGDSMMERVRDAVGTPAEKEDTEHLWVHRDEWKDDPELAQYDVVTNERHPKYSDDIPLFLCGSRERHWTDLSSVFDSSILVACRAA